MESSVQLGSSDGNSGSGRIVDRLEAADHPLYLAANVARDASVSLIVRSGVRERSFNFA